MSCKNSYKLPAEFLSLGKAQAKTSLPQANISHGGGGPNRIVLGGEKVPPLELINQEVNRGLSAGDLRDICLNETRCSTLPQHKLLTVLLPSSKRHDPAYLPGHQGRTREHLQAIKHDMEILWAKWSLYTSTDVQAKSLLFTYSARKISPALDTHKHRAFNR